MIYVLLLVIIALLMLLPRNWEGLVPYVKRMSGRQSANTADVKTVETLIDKALQEMSCNPVWEDDAESRVVKYDYQNGHFNMRIEPKKSFVSMSYLFFFNTSMENLSLVRSLCNQVNMNSEIERVVYSLNEEKNEIDLHIITGIKPTKEGTVEMLKRVMANIFGWQNAFVRRFNELIDESGKAEGGDKELSDAEWQRELFLLRQQELIHQSVGEIRQEEGNPLALGTLVKKVMGMEGFAPSEMTVAGSEMESINGRTEIFSYDLSSPLIKDKKFVAQEAVLRLSYFDLRQPDVRRQMTIHLHAEKEDANTMYFRVTVTVIPLSVSRSVAFNTPLNHGDVNSVLVAYDLTPSKQRTDEFLYMWKEAQEKQKNGEEETLSDEQRLISECVDKKTAENLYRGRQLYLNERFYEALFYLEAAYMELAPYFEQMKPTVKEKFYDLCFYLGFCYTELKQYKQAYYYLDIVSGLHRITYTTEFVNCMVNSGDIRSLSYIEQLINQMRMEQELGDDDEDTAPQEHLTKFVNFLKRRKAYVLIERRQFEEAKTLLNELLEDPESNDFAISELAYIKRLESHLPEDSNIEDLG